MKKTRSARDSFHSWRLEFILPGAMATLLLSGCVVAPVPLHQTESRIMWYGPESAPGVCLVIKEDVGNWYFPIVASVEGPSKMHNDSWSFQYSLGNVLGENPITGPHWSDMTPLPWLDLEQSDSTSGWKGIERLDGTPYWVAVRVASVEKHGVNDPVWRVMEVAVFSRTVLKFRRIFTTDDGEDLSGHPTAGRVEWHYDKQAHTIVYHSHQGPRKLDLLEGTDTPL